jgi:hypothetical protein
VSGFSLAFVKIANTCEFLAVNSRNFFLSFVLSLTHQTGGVSIRLSLLRDFRR